MYNVSFQEEMKWVHAFYEWWIFLSPISETIKQNFMSSHSGRIVTILLQFTSLNAEGFTQRCNEECPGVMAEGQSISEVHPVSFSSSMDDFCPLLGCGSIYPPSSLGPWRLCELPL